MEDLHFAELHDEPLFSLIQSCQHFGNASTKFAEALIPVSRSIKPARRRGKIILRGDAGDQASLKTRWTKRREVTEDEDRAEQADRDELPLRLRCLVPGATVRVCGAS